MHKFEKVIQIEITQGMINLDKKVFQKIVGSTWGSHVARAVMRRAGFNLERHQIEVTGGLIGGSKNPL